MNLLQTLSAPIGRTLLALIFFASGVHKVFSYAGTQGYMEAFNISGSLLPLVIIIEVLAGGLLLLVSHGAGAYALDNRLKSETM